MTEKTSNQLVGERPYLRQCTRWLLASIVIGTLLLFYRALFPARGTESLAYVVGVAVFWSAYAVPCVPFILLNMSRADWSRRRGRVYRWQAETVRVLTVLVSTVAMLTIAYVVFGKDYEKKDGARIALEASTTPFELLGTAMLFISPFVSAVLAFEIYSMSSVASYRQKRSQLKS